MSAATDFPKLLAAFFTERLMQQRQASPHTIASYREIPFACWSSMLSRN